MASNLPNNSMNAEELHEYNRIAKEMEEISSPTCVEYVYDRTRFEENKGPKPKPTEEQASKLQTWSAFANRKPVAENSRSGTATPKLGQSDLKNLHERHQTSRDPPSSSTPKPTLYLALQEMSPCDPAVPGPSAGYGSFFKAMSDRNLGQEPKIEAKEPVEEDEDYVKVEVDEEEDYEKVEKYGTEMAEWEEE